jgi:hypothetical protein
MAEVIIDQARAARDRDNNLGQALTEFTARLATLERRDDPLAALAKAVIDQARAAQDQDNNLAQALTEFTARLAMLGLRDDQVAALAKAMTGQTETARVMCLADLTSRFGETGDGRDLDEAWNTFRRFLEEEISARSAEAVLREIDDMLEARRLADIPEKVSSWRQLEPESEPERKA